MTSLNWSSGHIGDAEMPARGERLVPLVEVGGLVIEEIASGTEVAPVRYEQDHDEWVLLVHGSARVRVDHDVVELGTGDWLWLPAGVVHTVETVAAGTRWLAVHLPPGSDFGASGGPASLSEPTRRS